MEAIENDLAEIIENAPKKEPKSLSVTSLKRKHSLAQSPQRAKIPVGVIRAQVTLKKTNISR